MTSVGRQGFTLVEILVVVTIVGILAALCVPAFFHVLMNAKCAKCISNQRQIGLALLLYANDHDGQLPPTSHSTGSMFIQYSWIYQLADYLGKMDEVRVCPADEPDRQRTVINRKATSYVLNDIVFDPDEYGPQYNSLQNLPYPARTALLFILSADLNISPTWDHAHCADWYSWGALTAGIEVDRHRVGARAADRCKGSTNILYADGHVENIKARDLKRLVDAGHNPGAVPLSLE